MGLSKDYATALYDWLKDVSGVEVFRQPIEFDEDEEQPNEYITYSSYVGSFATEFMQSITIYSKSTSWAKVMDIVDKLESAITEHGVKVVEDWGIMTIHKGNPFAQDKPDEDSSYRSAYVNLLIKIYQKNV
jgi:hypothetical protein